MKGEKKIVGNANESSETEQIGTEELKINNTSKTQRTFEWTINCGVGGGGAKQIPVVALHVNNTK